MGKYGSLGSGMGKGNGISIPKVGGMVSIKGRVGDKIVGRKVPIAPAFDPVALSMVPIPGWKAPVDGGVFIPGWALVAAKSDIAKAA